MYPTESHRPAGASSLSSGTELNGAVTPVGSIERNAWTFSPIHMIATSPAIHTIRREPITVRSASTQASSAALTRERPRTPAPSRLVLGAEALACSLTRSPMAPRRPLLDPRARPLNGPAAAAAEPVHAHLGARQPVHRRV